MKNNELELYDYEYNENTGDKHSLFFTMNLYLISGARAKQNRGNYM